jgi:hypothetical protein
MADNPNPDASNRRGNDHDQENSHDRDPNHDSGAASPTLRDAFAGRYRLTQAGERYLHFNGAYYDGPYLVIDHDRCLTGGCRYQTEAENLADLDAWYLSQDREPDQDDPEAGL